MHRLRRVLHSIRWREALSNSSRMQIYRSAAKVNLTLDVLSRRRDGYHELQSVVHTVGLWDVLSFDFDYAPGFAFHCNRPELETPDNLCLKAARAWLDVAENYGVVVFPGVSITLHKNIPTGAGLGGGSGNAAATLLALNRHFREVVPERTMARIAAHLGADVPLFLRGGCALLEGIGERLTPLPALDGWLVIVQPPAGLSTPAVYAKWDTLTASSAVRTPARSAALVKAVKACDLMGVAKGLHNDLRHAAQTWNIGIGSLIEMLRDAGALGAEMTGSGSAVFGLFQDEPAARRAGRQVAAQLNDPGAAKAGHRIMVEPFCATGVGFMVEDDT